MVLKFFSRPYVNELRIKNNIPKPCKSTREYGSIPELPPGQQLQADFGEYWALREDKKRIKLYLVVFILAHSRYKYVLWQNRPFTTVDFIRCLESCFEVFGGTPLELVIDQDHLMTVSENYGDIIHTYEFERCKNRHQLSIWLCRKADPESKGMVESCVKFVKYNFAKNRYFKDINQWTEDCFAWLKRTGNGKVHAETKKIPAEVYLLEKEHLRPIISLSNQASHSNIVTTTVRKNNTIRYKASRYTVPFGTHTKFQTVSIQENDGQLQIYDPDGQLLALHPLSTSPGELVRNSNHARNTSESIQQLIDEAKDALGNTQQADTFIKMLHKTRGKYIRDQLNLIIKVAKTYDSEVIRLTLLTCLDGKFYSANDFRDFADYLFRQVTFEQVLSNQKLRLMPDIPKMTVPDVKVIQRQPEFYTSLIVKGGKYNG